MIAAPIDLGLVSTIPGWFFPPDGLNMIKRTYGDIHLSGAEVAPAGWESDNMMLALGDWLPRGKLYVNRKVWPVLESALVACLALGDGYEIRTLGCFAPRLKRVNGDLSTHSWGIAVDLNAEQNPLAACAGDAPTTDIPPAWVYEFERRGFCWGGRWRRPDPMHFQLAGPAY